MRRSFLLCSAFALLAPSGCGSLLGLDDFTEAEAGAASSSSGATSSSTTDPVSSSSATSTSDASSSVGSSSSSGDGGGSGGSGAGEQGGGGSGAGEQGGGGAGGGGEPCDDEGAIEDCYEGEPGTVDVGVCVAGTRRCDDGFWTACQDQVLPAEEDLATWTDESCETDAAEVHAFVRYDGDNDDYPVGFGAAVPGDGPTVAVGIYGALTVGGTTYSTLIDEGTVFVRHSLDGAVLGSAFLPAYGRTFWPGNGFSIFSGYTQPQTINGVTFPATFVSLLDANLAPVAAMAGECNEIRDQHGLCGSGGSGAKRLERFSTSVQNGTISSTLVADFGSVGGPSSMVRTSGGTMYIVVGGSLNGSLTFGSCMATGTADPLIATFAASGSGACVSMSTLESNGSASIQAVEILGNTLFVSGSVNGSIRDENGTLVVSEGSSSAFVARMTLANGVPSLIWLRVFGGVGATGGVALAPDDAGGTGWLVKIGESADFGGVSLSAGHAFVSLDSQGSVRYARAVGSAFFSPTMRRHGDAIFFTDFIEDIGAPFGLTEVPPAGSSSDTFLSIHALP